MKKYEKPNIVDEIIEIEDIISSSPGGQTDLDDEDFKIIGD